MSGWKVTSWGVWSKDLRRWMQNGSGDAIFGTRSEARGFWYRNGRSMRRKIVRMEGRRP